MRHPRPLSVLTVLAALCASALILSLPPTSPAAAETPGRNVALASGGGVVTASGSEGGGSYGWTPAKAIDGQTSGPSGTQTSRWSSDYSDAAWLAVQPAKATVIDHVTLYWEAACPQRYKLQVSHDASTWVDATEELSPATCGVERHAIGADADPGTAWEHVRMQTVERRPFGGVKYGVSLWELEIWDGAEPEPPVVPALVPQPVIAQPVDAEPYRLTPDTRIAAVGAAADVADLLAAELRTSTGFRLPVVARPRPGDIELRIDRTPRYTVDGATPTQESYVLDADVDGVRIVATDAHGVFNGVQTLRQLLPAWAGADREVRASWSVGAIHVEDAPRYAYRGVMLDVARSFQEVEEVKTYIDSLAAFKMSRLHLHLADDQGWRIEITNEGKDADDPIDYTRLTEVSGDTAMSQPFVLNELGRTGYYTQEEYREIVAYARERFVTVVPEVDVPSHTNAALHAIPELNTDRSLPSRDPGTGAVDWNGTGDVGYSALDEQHPVTYQFVDHVFSQLAEMTGGPLVHMGGDESHAMGHERYVDFIRQAVPVVREAAGTGVMGWSEFAEAGLSEGPGYWEGSVLHYWVGSGDWARDFVSKGGKVVVSQAGGAYVDMKYDPTTPIGLNWACSGDCDIDRYYSWEPTTTVQGGIPEAGVLGVEAPMWSENIRGLDQAQYMTLPRAAAVLETGWTARDRKDYAGFADRLGRLGSHLSVAGHNFYETRRSGWTATSAGTDVRTRPRTDRHEVLLVAAPGTKASPDGTALVPDRVTTDGDPASASTLTAPLTATATCGSTELAVTFDQQQARDRTHGAGLYTGSVEHTFGTDTSCSVQTSDGTTHQIEVDVDRRAPAPAGDPDPGPATLQVGDGATVPSGEWVPFRLSGFVPGPYVEIAVDGVLAYHLRVDEDGRFERHGLIPRGLTAGEHDISATQGERSVAVSVDVTSDVRALADPIAGVRVSGASSEETVGEDGRAVNAVDGDRSTIWHTRWSSDPPGYPHHITLDLGAEHEVSGLEYLQRQDGTNTRMADFEVRVSGDGSTWSDPVATGTFTGVTTPQVVELEPTRARYVRLVGLSSVNGQPYGGAAEIRVGGTR